MKTKLTLLFSLILIASVRAQVQVLPPDFTLLGKNSGDYLAELHQYIDPLSTNGDYLLPKAVRSATDPVYFLQRPFFGVAPPVGVQTYFIPDDVYVYFPIVHYAFDNIGNIPPLTVEELIDALVSVVNSITEVHATIDGVALTNLLAYRTMAPIFSVFYPTNDNIITVLLGEPYEGLDDPVVAAGYLLMLKPLAAGLHDFRTGFTFGGVINASFERHYQIIVFHANHPPVADASATLNRIISPDNVDAKVVLDASHSSDPDHDPLTYSWREGGAILSMASVSINVLGPGQHVISLLVSDGQLTATNTITLNVITAEQAVRELALAVQNVGFSRKQTHPLLKPLEDARKAFQRGQLDKGIHQLKEFQEEVRAHVVPANSVVAQGLLQSAQDIIDAINPPQTHPAVVLPNDAIVDGKTIGDWSAEYWQWILPIPTAQSPAFDPDGSKAHVNQPDGPVFFVSSIFQLSATVTRSFTVPEGKYLFVPLLTHFNDNVDVNPPLTVEQMRDQTAAGVDLIDELHASIDGVPVPDLFSHRAASPVFSIDYASTDHLYTFILGHPFSGLNDPIVAEGYYLMLEPLPAGTHVVNFGAGVGPPINFHKDITANITVVPVPLAERVQELMSRLELAGLPAKTSKHLLQKLEEAERSFARDHLKPGIHQLQAFQHAVRKEFERSNPALAAALIQAAEQIIDRAKAHLP